MKTHSFKNAMSLNWLDETRYILTPETWVYFLSTTKNCPRFFSILIVYRENFIESTHCLKWKLNTNTRAYSLHKEKNLTRDIRFYPFINRRPNPRYLNLFTVYNIQCTNTISSADFFYCNLYLCKQNN